MTRIPTSQLTEALVRALSDEEIAIRLRVYDEDSADDLTTPDGVSWLYKEQERRAAVASGMIADDAQPDPASAPTPWFFVTARPRRSNDTHVLLVQARDGATVEDAVRRHGYTGLGCAIQWTPLADVVAGEVGVSKVVVIPEVRA